MMKTILNLLRKKLLPLMLLAVSSTCFADTIKVNPAAQYANDSVGTRPIRNECNFDQQIIGSLVHHSRYQVEVTNADLSTVPGKTLKVVITSVHAVGGGGFTGPKWGNLLVTLFDDGRVVDEYKVNVHTTGGRWKTCETLTRIARKLGAKAAKHLLTPHTQHPAPSKDDTEDSAGVDDSADDPEDAEDKK